MEGSPDSSLSSFMKIESMNIFPLMDLLMVFVEVEIYNSYDIFTLKFCWTLQNQSQSRKSQSKKAQSSVNCKCILKSIVCNGGTF